MRNAWTPGLLGAGAFLLYIPRSLCLKSVGIAALCAALSLLFLKRANAAQARREAEMDKKESAMALRARARADLSAGVYGSSLNQPLKAISWPMGLACALSALSLFFIIGALLLIGK